MNFAMCLLVAALSLLPDTADPQIHLAEKFRTTVRGKVKSIFSIYDCSGFSWTLRLNKIYG